jgi:hypothetical protein
MPTIYEICGDEAWTHTNPPLNRYWCFFGGLLATESDADRLETALRACKARRNYKPEVKWGNVTPPCLSTYKELVDIFFDHLLRYELRYRQIFLDRSFVHVPTDDEPARTTLDVQFLICYQFLKHSFGILHLPRASNGFDKLFIRLDTHSSQKHLKELQGFTENLPVQLGRTDIDIQLAHVCSHHLVRIGLCDVLLGAAGSYGNRMQDRRQPGQRGMTDRMKCRIEMAKFIYNHLRNVNKINRGKDAFNWFESTGQDGHKENRLHHKARIWKFQPRNFRIDKGWHNDHLDKMGLYQGADIVDPVSSIVSSDPF